MSSTSGYCLLIGLSALFAASGQVCGQFIGASVATRIESKPRDYSFSPVSSRVRALVSHFESIDQVGSRDPFAYKRISDVISLSEAATKLHVLSDTVPLETKCDKYVKLIGMPDIRTFAMVNQLSREAKLFDEIKQDDANLVSRLQDERKFDALGRMQTILQTLETEQSLGQSKYEPAVQKDLLDCVNYYIYRHQRAVAGVVSQVRRDLVKLAPFLNQVEGSEVVLRKFRDSLNRLEQYESNSGSGTAVWLEELSKLSNLVVENNYEIPIVVQQFVANPKRIKRLQAIDEALQDANKIKTQLVELESRSPNQEQPNSYYVHLLKELQEISDNFNDILPDEIKRFVDEPARANLIRTFSDRDSIDEQLTHEVASDDDVKLAENSIAKQEQETESEATELNHTAEPAEQPIASTTESPFVEQPLHGIDQIDDKINLNHEEQTPFKWQQSYLQTDHTELEPLQPIGCAQVFNELQHRLQTFSQKDLDLDDVRALLDQLSLLRSGCTRDSSFEDHPSKGQTRWLMFSFGRKLSTWLNWKLQEPEFERSERASLAPIMSALNKIRS